MSLDMLVEIRISNCYEFCLLFSKGFLSKELESFSAKEKQLSKKDKILNCHFTEKLTITKRGLNRRRKNEKNACPQLFYF